MRPPVHGGRQQTFTVSGRPAAGPEQEPRAGDILVSADYFRTMEIPLVKGRAFNEQDAARSAPVAIVSETLARQVFPEEDPIGRRIRLNERSPMTCCAAAGPVENVWREIVGVAGDVRQASLDEAPAATIYRPFTQIVEHDMFLMVRTSTNRDVPRVATVLTGKLRRPIVHGMVGGSSDATGNRESGASGDGGSSCCCSKLRRPALVLAVSLCGVMA